MDGRKNYSFAEVSDYGVYYTKLRMQGSGDWDGAEEGLSTYAIKELTTLNFYCRMPESRSLEPSSDWLQCDMLILIDVSFAFD